LAQLVGALILWPQLAPAALAMLGFSDFLRGEHYEIIQAVAETGSDQILIVAKHLAAMSTIPNVKSWAVIICDCVDDCEVFEQGVDELIWNVRQGSLERQIGRVLRQLAKAPLDPELRREARGLYTELALAGHPVADLGAPS
jgi:hypothetical protein